MEKISSDPNFNVQNVPKQPDHKAFSEAVKRVTGGGRIVVTVATPSDLAILPPLDANPDSLCILVPKQPGAQEAKRRKTFAEIIQGAERIQFQNADHLRDYYDTPGRYSGD